MTDFKHNKTPHEFDANGNPVKHGSYWCDTHIGWTWCTWDGNQWTVDKYGGKHGPMVVTPFEIDKNI